MALQPQNDTTADKGIVLYDGDCPLCRRSVAILKRLDWWNRLAYHSARDVENLPEAQITLNPSRLLEEMHLLAPDRRHAYAGYAAFRWIAWRLPLTMPIAWMMWIPGVPWIGNKIYLMIAKNRMNLVPCKDGVCTIPRRN